MIQKISQPQSRAERIWLAHAVQQIEAQGPLNDAQALQTAALASSDREERLLHRAWFLGQTQGLPEQLARLRELGFGTALLLVALVVLLAWGTARATLAGGQLLNVPVVWTSLLGLHLLTLLLWCLAWLLPWPASAAFLGRLWLALVTRWPWGRGDNPGNAQSLALAGRDLLQRERLLPWLLGLVSHGVWALSFVVMLAVLGFAFSFQAFRLTWESTILGPQFFVDFVQITGWLPNLLGFAVPDVTSVAQPNAVLADQRAWALWLMGCVLLYGLVPRALLALWCWCVWRARLRRLRLDTAEPYFRKVLARFDALRTADVLDEEHAWRGQSAVATAGQAVDAQAGAVVGFELPPEVTWPAVVVPEQAANQVWQGLLSGSSDERQAVLAALGQRRPAALLLVCHGASTPDRGTERFMRACAQNVGACRVLLVTAPGIESQTQRWVDWLAQSGLARDNGMAVLPTADAAVEWLSSEINGGSHV